MHNIKPLPPFEKDDFATNHLQRSLVYLRPGLIMTLALVVLFYPIDPMMLNERGADFLQNARLYLMTPAILLALFLSYTRISAKLFFTLISLSYLSGGMCFVYAQYLSPDATVAYILVALVQTFLLLTVAVRTPWYLAIPVIASIYVAVLVVLLNFSEIDTGSQIAFLTGLGATGCISGVDSYIRDRNARRLFASENALGKVQDEQLKWSALVTRVLRHELSNQITAIATSIKMIERSNHDNKPIDAYLDRADRSIKQLRETLNKTTNATNIEEAVDIGRGEVFSIAELISDMLFHYENIYPDIRFNVDTENDFWVRGNNTLLSRAFGNIVENAIRHHRKGSPISITINEHGLVSVTNIGDALPENKDALFDIGQATEESKNLGLFGLGLFIVRKIVDVHGGLVYAEDLKHQQGANFVMRLPLAKTPSGASHTPSDNPSLALS